MNDYKEIAKKEHRLLGHLTLLLCVFIGITFVFDMVDDETIKGMGWWMTYYCVALLLYYVAKGTHGILDIFGFFFYLALAIPTTIAWMLIVMHMLASPAMVQTYAVIIAFSIFIFVFGILYLYRVHKFFTYLGGEEIVREAREVDIREVQTPFFKSGAVWYALAIGLAITVAFHLEGKVQSLILWPSFIVVVSIFSYLLYSRYIKKIGERQTNHEPPKQ